MPKKNTRTYVIAQGQTHIDAAGNLLQAGAELELTDEQARALGGKVIAREELEAAVSEEAAGLLEAAEQKAKALEAELAQARKEKEDLEGELEKLRGINVSLTTRLEGLQQEKAGLLEQIGRLKAASGSSVPAEKGEARGKKE